ncbi:MAG: ferrous iron transport protein A [Cryomorphaceae bacterium]|jgi:ferrous iron transport protein A|nr:ferrous iron transport protein A [Cryomorphaceae bacterium]
MDYSSVDQPLSSIKPGNAVYVKDIVQSDLKTKLMEMGIVKGQTLIVMFRAPFGDPIAVDVNGYLLSLRLEEAALVKVEIASVQ